MAKLTLILSDKMTFGFFGVYHARNVHFLRFNFCKVNEMEGCASNLTYSPNVSGLVVATKKKLVLIIGLVTY